MLSWQQGPQLTQHHAFFGVPDAGHVCVDYKTPSPLKCDGKPTSNRTPTHRRQSGGAMCDDMDGLMSKSADTTCTSTPTCEMQRTLKMCITEKLASIIRAQFQTDRDR